MLVELVPFWNRFLISGDLRGTRRGPSQLLDRGRGRNSEPCLRRGVGHRPAAVTTQSQRATARWPDGKVVSSPAKMIASRAAPVLGGQADFVAVSCECFEVDRKLAGQIDDLFRHVARFDDAVQNVPDQHKPGPALAS
jgi:hypothetical protein